MEPSTKSERPNKCCTCMRRNPHLTYLRRQRDTYHSYGLISLRKRRSNRYIPPLSFSASSLCQFHMRDILPFYTRGLSTLRYTGRYKLHTLASKLTRICTGSIAIRGYPTRCILLYKRKSNTVARNICRNLDLDAAFAKKSSCGSFAKNIRLHLISFLRYELFTPKVVSNCRYCI